MVSWDFERTQIIFVTLDCITNGIYQQCCIISWMQHQIIKAALYHQHCITLSMLYHISNVALLYEQWTLSLTTHGINDAFCHQCFIIKTALHYQCWIKSPTLDHHQWYSTPTILHCIINAASHNAVLSMLLYTHNAVIECQPIFILSVLHWRTPSCNAKLHTWIYPTTNSILEWC